MFTTYTLALCVCSFLTQSISAQCIGAYNGVAADNLGWQSGNALAWETASAPWAASPCAASAYAGLPYAAAPFTLNEWGAGYSPANLAASNGGGLAITSVSPISPIGVSMTSENAYEGPLAVSGNIPFLGAVALEGALPTGGAGAVAYGSGNGNVAMINEDFSGALGYGAGIGSAYGYNGLAGPLVEAGIAGPSYGFNGIAGLADGGIAGPTIGYNVNSGRFSGCGCGAAF